VRERRLSEVQRLQALLAAYVDGTSPPPNTVIFLGAIAPIGDIRLAPRFEMELADPARGRHGYDVRTLPIVA
jgi:hypothetical protein